MRLTGFAVKVRLHLDFPDCRQYSEKSHRFAGRRPPDADIEVEEAEHYEGGEWLHELANPKMNYSGRLERGSLSRPGKIA